MSAPYTGRGLEFEAITHTYWFDGQAVPSVTQVLERTGLTDFSSIPEPYRQRALERGRRVHVAAQLLTEGTLDLATVDELDEPYLNACRAFLRDSGFEVLGQERRIYHPTYRYAGTCDAYGLWQGNFAIIDYCTGDVWESAKDLQTSAYAEALRQDPPDEWWGFTKATPIVRLGVHLKKTGAYTCEPFPDARDFTTFVHAVAVVHEQIRRQLKGRRSAA